MSHQNPSMQFLGGISKQREVGEMVNSHVLEYAEEPKPDFAEMERTLRTFGNIKKSGQCHAEPGKAVPETD